MLPAAFPVWILIAYFAGLFALAWSGDKMQGTFARPGFRSGIYALGSCVNWGFATCFGLIGISGSGSESLLIWFVPVIVFAAGSTMICRMVRFAKKRNVISIADYLTACYGRTAPVSAVAAFILLAASIPLNAVILRAIDLSLMIVISNPSAPSAAPGGPFCSIIVSASMTMFVLVIGTRRLDAMGRQRGMILVTAAEIVMRFTAIVALGGFVVWGLYGSIPDLLGTLNKNPQAYALLTSWPQSSIVSLTMVSTFGLLFVPSQFHMSVTENRDPRDIRVAAWFVPVASAISILAALPVVIAALIVFPNQNMNIETALIALPLHAHSSVMVAAGLVAGFGAMSSMILVSTVNITMMASNDLVMPVLLHPWFSRGNLWDEGFGPRLLTIRRVIVVMTFLLSGTCAYFLDEPTLSALMKTAIGLFGQIVPACLIAVLRPRVRGGAAVWGLAAGTMVWFYAIALPLLGAPVTMLHPLLADGPFQIKWLCPGALFGFRDDPLTLGLFWSTFANLFGFASYWLKLKIFPETSSSLESIGSALKGMQSDAFLRPDAKVTLGDLFDTLAHYFGPERTMASFDAYMCQRGVEYVPAREVDELDLRFGEDLLATVIGNAASQLVVSLFLKRRAVSAPEPAKPPRAGTADEAAGIEGGGIRVQEGLASRHGITLFDKKLRLVAWNTNRLKIFNYPPGFLKPGLKLHDIIRWSAERGHYGPGPVDQIVARRLADYLDTSKSKRILAKDGKIYDCRSLRLADGFLVLHHIDVTEEARFEQTLEAENETLERRVRERTEELQRLNADLIKAKAEAEEANVSKTRFLAAASHDLLQPLNAARLYATSLKERIRVRMATDDSLTLALNVEDSLEAVEDILTALLDISHLDAGATKPEITTFAVNDVFRQLQLEFEPTASEKGLDVTFIPSSVPIVSDRRLLRRLLRNLISNAIKYTAEGRVIAGVRLQGSQARIEIWDTGLGIPKSKQRAIFREFERLPNAVQTAPGVGLGLSIVERLSRVLNHEIHLRSKPGCGSVFSVLVPRAAVLAAAQAFPTAGGAPAQRSLDGLIVAAIDNEPAILMGMRALLGGWGCRIVAGSDLTSITEALVKSGTAPDVVIADYHLVETDGLSVIAALRGRYGPCHAVLITADRSPALRDRAHAMNVRFLNKPVKPAVLRSLLSQWRLVKQAAE